MVWSAVEDQGARLRHVRRVRRRSVYPLHPHVPKHFHSIDRPGMLRPSAYQLVEER